MEAVQWVKTTYTASEKMYPGLTQGYDHKRELLPKLTLWLVLFFMCVWGGGLINNGDEQVRTPLVHPCKTQSEESVQ